MKNALRACLILPLLATGFVGIAPASAQTPGADMLPPNAKPGECYTRVWVPAVYKSDEVRVLAREGSERVEVIPARYETVQEKVMTREASQRLEIVPAEYGWEEQQVLVSGASSRLVEVPATYGWEEEKVLDRPAHTIWKKGRNPLQRVENGTGEIMCLIEVPATYKTVRKRVLKEAAHTKKVEIPAQYKTVKKQVLVKPATTRTVEIPAEHKTLTVRREATPAQEKRIAIPEEWSTVTKRELVNDGHMEWRAILCETNIEVGLVTRIQKSLKTAGHDPGPIDGVIGSGTLRAIDSYQAAKGLARGGMTMETLKSLGVVNR